MKIKFIYNLYCNAVEFDVQTEKGSYKEYVLTDDIRKEFEKKNKPNDEFPLTMNLLGKLATVDCMPELQGMIAGYLISKGELAKVIGNKETDSLLFDLVISELVHPAQQLMMTFSPSLPDGEPSVTECDKCDAEDCPSRISSDRVLN